VSQNTPPVAGTAEAKPKGAPPSTLYKILAVVLCLYVLLSIIFPQFPEQRAGKLSLFGLIGLLLVFIGKPIKKGMRPTTLSRGFDGVLCLLTVLTFGYLFVQAEPMFDFAWVGGKSLGDRSGTERGFEIVIGTIGLLLVLEAARRCIGWTLSILAVLFLIYGLFGHLYPDWLFRHPPKTAPKLVAKTFLQTGGVLGTALSVMFKYVFLFVLFGALLEMTGATSFIINFARRLFRNSVGGPAKVSVVSSGLMGSLSGSAVANTATTGTFTIPLMTGTGFTKETAGGVEAAASSGGALMPPIMGAGAYMMLELIDGVKYVEILQAAIIPALLYYTALLLAVHWQARKRGVKAGGDDPSSLPLVPMRGFLFFGAFLLLIFLLLPPMSELGRFSIPPGLTADKAAAICVIAVVVLGWLHPSTRLGPGRLVQACTKAARGGVALVAAAACVGIILGVVGITGLGRDLPQAILSLSRGMMILGLLLLMVSTIILGMGLPSVVCYLLMATIVGGMIADFGVVELSMHLFIFYFSMMSMVTPPVALAAYAAGAISGGNIMATAFAAFRFALVGFALPFAFVLKPEIIMLSADGSPAGFAAIAVHVVGALAGVILLAGGAAGFAFRRLPNWARWAVVACALVSFFTRTQAGNLELGVHIGSLVLGFCILAVCFFLAKDEPTDATLPGQRIAA